MTDSLPLTATAPPPEDLSRSAFNTTPHRSARCSDESNCSQCYQPMLEPSPTSEVRFRKSQATASINVGGLRLLLLPMRPPRDTSQPHRTGRDGSVRFQTDKSYHAIQKRGKPCRLLC